MQVYASVEAYFVLLAVIVIGAYFLSALENALTHRRKKRQK